ncbi:MAG TPA: hypothetical protein VH934_22295, partial [Xanthobacteraceae bacterium]
MIHLDFVRTKCASTAMWRASLATKYPHDIRNGAAYGLLKSLAALTDNSAISAETKAKLATYHGAEFVAATQTACREVCFRYEPQGLQEVCDRIVELMEQVPPLQNAD